MTVDSSSNPDSASTEYLRIITKGRGVETYYPALLNDDPSVATKRYCERLTITRYLREGIL